MMDVWNAGAPAIDILAPDIYSNFSERCDLYHRYNNPLLIPEMVRTDHTIGAIFYALGQHDAIGFSPFGMESLPEFTEKIGEAYQFISTISPIILENQGKNVTGGAFLGKDHPKESLIVGDYKIDLSIARHYSFPTPDYPSGIFIQVGPDEYLVGGRGLNVKFNPINPGEYNVGVASVEDGEYIDGRWVAGRILNGDEILSGRGVRLRGDYYMTTRIKLYRYR